MPDPAARGAGRVHPLVRELLAEGLAVRLRVTGRSMAPWLVDDDEVTLEPCAPGEAALGDVVLAQAPGRPPVLHRVVSASRLAGGGRRIVTKGDALNTPDPPVGEELLLGRVTSVRRAGGCPAGRPGSGPVRRAAAVLAALASRTTPRLFATVSRRLASRAA